MRIFYLSTALEDEDFNYLESKASKKPNPAGQNFHAKLLVALSDFSPVYAYSLIPNLENVLSEASLEKSKSLLWRYLEPMEGKIGRFLNQGRLIGKTILSEHSDLNENDILLYDSLNLSLAKAARFLKRKKACKTVAILTDDPQNITGAARFYVKQCLSLSASCNGYFALTEGLYNLFSKNGAPHLVKMGLMEELEKQESPIHAPYMYYGGALFVKDGTKALLDAYQSVRPNLDLVLSGHGAHQEECRKAAIENPRIHFLGQISKKEHYAYLQNATLLLNPRIFRKSLDKVSVPSKLLEYLASGVPILSTYSTPIFASFGNSINLLNNHGEDPTPALESFFQEHISEEGKLIGIVENHSAKELMAQNGVAKVASDLTSFCASLTSK